MKSVESKTYRNKGNMAVLRHVPESAKAILDVGCGAGDNARILAHPDRIVDGVTLSESEREEAMPHCRHVVIHDLENGLPPELTGPYDCVICSHVLEHICWPEKLLKDIHKRLTPDGIIVVALPNLLFYRSRWNILRGRFRYEESGLMDNTHFRWYSYRCAQELLSGAGYAVLSAQADGSFPIPYVRKWLPSILVRVVDRAACYAFPGMFGYQMVFTAKADRKYV